MPTNVGRIISSETACYALCMRNYSPGSTHVQQICAIMHVPTVQQMMDDAMFYFKHIKHINTQEYVDNAYAIDGMILNVSLTAGHVANQITALHKRWTKLHDALSVMYLEHGYTETFHPPLLDNRFTIMTKG